MPNTDNTTTLPQLHILPANSDSRTYCEHILDAWQSIHHIEMRQIDLIHQPEVGEGLKIETVRELKQNLSYSVPDTRYRHIFLHHLEKASQAAQQSLLKLLEDGAPRTQWWLTSTNQQIILPTIHSRCRVIIADTSSLIQTQKVEEVENIIKILTTISSAKYGELIDQAEAYKSKEDAEHALYAGLQFLDQNKTNHPEQPAVLAALRHTLKSQSHLEANVSPRLVIEDWFFQMKKLNLKLEQP